jgi:hypothetical protein
MGLTQDYLKSILDYDPETGLFKWKVNRGRVAIGHTAGGLTSDGYIRIRIDKVDWLGHQLAWLYMTGSLPVYPQEEIDHLNTLEADNRWDNLCKCSRLENMRNPLSRLAMRESANRRWLVT